MKKYLFFLFLVALSITGMCDSAIDGAINFYSRYGHEANDEVVFAKLHFRSKGLSDVIMTYEKGGSENGDGWLWSILEIKNGQWRELKSLDVEGNVSGASAASFDYRSGGFVFLKKFNQNGLLTHGKGVWTFVYLDDDVVKTAFFHHAEDIGLTFETLKALMNTHHITVERRPAPSN